MPPTPGPVAQVYQGVSFYPACGNEVLDLDGTTWYQLLPDEQHVLLETDEDENSVGTTQVTVYTDGRARFVSDSGDLTTWLSRQERTFDWVC